MAHRRRWLAPLFLGSMLAVVAAGAASPGGPYAKGSLGYDVSFPQCHSALPAPGDFAIVGVTGGRPFTTNRCLKAEFTWAGGAGSPPGLYVNLQGPFGSTGPRWSRNGPGGACGRHDRACKFYNYGANAVKKAMQYATFRGASAQWWWLDVETTNSWAKDTALNRETIRGALDYLRAQGVTAGIYSTSFQWSVIAGGYRPGVPNWVAGAEARRAAPGYCRPSHAFGGGRVALVQFPRNGLDGLYGC